MWPCPIPNLIPAPLPSFTAHLALPLGHVPLSCDPQPYTRPLSPTIAHLDLLGDVPLSCDPQTYISPPNNSSWPSIRSCAIVLLSTTLNQLPPPTSPIIAHLKLWSSHVSLSSSYPQLTKSPNHSSSWPSFLLYTSNSYQCQVVQISWWPLSMTSKRMDLYKSYRELSSLVIYKWSIVWPIVLSLVDVIADTLLINSQLPHQ